MGHGAYWFSDVIEAILPGRGSTDLFLWLHESHDEEPSSMEDLLDEFGRRLCQKSPAIAWRWSSL